MQVGGHKAEQIFKCQNTGIIGTQKRKSLCNRVFQKIPFRGRHLEKEKPEFTFKGILHAFLCTNHGGLKDAGIKRLCGSLASCQPGQK